MNQAGAVVDALGMSVQQPRFTAQQVPPIRFPGHELNQTRLLQRFALEWKAVDALLR